MKSTALPPALLGLIFTLALVGFTMANLSLEVAVYLLVGVAALAGGVLLLPSPSDLALRATRRQALKTQRTHQRAIASMDPVERSLLTALTPADREYLTGLGWTDPLAKDSPAKGL